MPALALPLLIGCLAIESHATEVRREECESCGEGSSSAYYQQHDHSFNANFHGATAKDRWLKDNIEI